MITVTDTITATVVIMLEYDFMRNAFAAAGVAAVVSGLVGYFLVLRGQTFAGHALSHIGFAGATGAVLIGLAPVWGLVGFTVAAGIGMGMLGERISGRDVAIGVVLALALGFGLLFLHYYTAFATQATALLFGNVLAVDRSMIVTLAGLGMVTFGGLAAIMRPLIFASLQPELAEAKGVPLRFVSTAFLTIVALAVAESAQIVGILLVFALMVGPPATAQRAGDRAMERNGAVGGFCIGRSLGRHRRRLLYRLAGEFLHRNPERTRLFPHPRQLPAALGADTMSEQKARAVCVGEVLIEMARGADGRFSLACGGDTFNTAVYLARAGIDVGFATALGDDPYSESIMALAAAEGISTQLVLRVPGRLPGLCIIENGPAGERSFRYWREGAPARDLFELSDWMRLAEGLVSARLIYFSGITLSLYSNNGLGRFLALLEAARQQGAKVAFDGNFRPRGWKGDLARTRTVFIETLKRVDIALPTFDDEAVLWGDPSPETTVARLQAFGIGEIVVKNGPNSALVASAAPRNSCRYRRSWCRWIRRRRVTGLTPAILPHG